MAKLDNVKVVNENTVEYNGFVYELVTDEAKVCNLIQCFEDDEWLVRGGFYYVYDIDSDGDMVFNDEEEDSRYRNPNSNNWKVFRKSHAITIDKLTDAEGVVTITLPDGTKLEGTPSDLEKITRSMQALQAEHVDVSTKDNPAETVEVEDASEPVAERLQVGDYVKVITEGCNDCSEFGDIVKVTEDDKSNIPFNTDHLDGRYAGWHYEEDLVKATDEEVQMAMREAKQALLKEGDFARVIGVSHTEEACGPHNYEIGTVVNLVEYDNEDGDDSFKTAYINGDEAPAPYVHHKDLEPLTQEEAEHIAREAEEEKKAKEEREKWADIGREVGELRKGDLVKWRGSYHEINEVTPTHRKSTGFKFACHENGVTLGEDEDWAAVSNVELIVPVEQRFDTVG